MAVGEIGKAIDLLWKAHEEHDSNLPYLAVGQIFLEDIRPHPSFIELFHRVGLP